ncbi:MAG: hypothetical protein V3S85_02960 [Nitrospirales bacterium]
MHREGTEGWSDNREADPEPSTGARGGGRGVAFVAVHGLVIIRIARIKLGIDFGRVFMKNVFEFLFVLLQNLYLRLEILFLRLEILFSRFILLSRSLDVVKKRRIPRVRATINSLIMPKAVNSICHMVARSIAS